MTSNGKRAAIGAALTAVTAAALLTLGALDASAAITPRGDGSCTGPVQTAVKAKLHAAATARVTTLGQLVTTLTARTDPYGLNAAQVSTLQDASSGITALDGTLQSTCYGSVAELRAAGAQLYDGYRVYWLRVPQTRQVEAADRLGEQITELQDAAAKLDGRVGDDATARSDLAAMQTQLAAATAQVGTPPNAADVITTTAGLTPAKDMTANVATMHTSLDALQAARASLAQARASGQKVVQDLRGS